MAVTSFEKLSFQIQVEKKQTPFTVSKLNTLHKGVFTDQSINDGWITGPGISKSLCSDDHEHLVDEYIWSLMFDIFLNYDDKADKLILESHTPLCLHSDCFCKPALKYPYTSVLFPGERFCHTSHL